jgi:hypothetical protein
LLLVSGSPTGTVGEKNTSFQFFYLFFAETPKKKPEGIAMPSGFLCKNGGPSTPLDLIGPP